MEQTEERSYIAFISYRHLPLDKKVAELIQQKIEHFVVPKEYRDRTGGKDRLGLVFRDEDELPVGQSLSSSITYALDHSEYLIVICTPDLPKSQWCEKEIRYFIETHDRDHVIAVLADGEPAESFSPYLRFDYANDGAVRAEVEPLAANIDGPDKKIDRKRFHKEIVRVYAALLQCPFDALWQRERRYRTARLAIAAAVVFLAMSVFLAVVIRKNMRITQQNRDLEYQKSSILVSTGQQQLSANDIRGAADSARQALENKDTMPYDRDAQALLAEVLGAYQDTFYRDELVLEQTSVIVDADELSDGRILTADQFGMVRCYDKTGRQVLWTASSQRKGSEVFQTDIETRIETDETAGIVWSVNDTNIKALRLEDGEEAWSFSRQATDNFFAMSADRSMIAVIQYDSDRYDAKPDLVVLSSGTGEELRRLSLYVPEYVLNRGYAGQPVNGGAFSDNNRYLALMLYYEKQDDYQDVKYHIELIDLETGSVEEMGTIESTYDYNNVVLGMHVSSSGEQIYAVRYEGSEGKIYRMFMHRGDKTYHCFDSEQDVYQKNGHTPFARHLYLPSICKDQEIVTVFNNKVYVDDWAAEEQVYIGTQEEAIVGLTYGGPTDPSSIRLLIDNGYQTEIIPDEMTRWEERIEKGTIQVARMLEEGWEFLYTSEENPNRLMKHACVPEDPHGKSLTEGSVPTDRSFALSLSPSGDYLYIFPSYYSESWPMDVYSTKDWSLVASCLFDPITDSIAPAINPIDDGSVMIGLRIYHPDGSVSYLESYEEDHLRENQAEAGWLSYTARGVSSPDGSMISVAGIMLDPPAEIWKDGKGVESFFSYMGFADGKLNETIFSVSSDEVYVLGENGFLIMYGIPVLQEDGGLYYMEEEEPVYYIWNVKEDETIMIRDDCPQDLMHTVVAGEKDPVFAVADSEGGIRIYSMETKDSRLLSNAYHTGPVRAMGFFGEDKYLAVYTYTGRLDIYEVGTGEMVFSEEDPYPSKIVDLIDAYEDGEGHLLLIGKTNALTWGNGILIDQEEWTIIAKIPQVFCYLKNTNEILVLHDDLVRYPLYTADDLLSWDVTGK